MNRIQSRVSFTTPSGPTSKLHESLSSCHPFTQQIDILLSSPNPILEQRLSNIQTEYYSGRIELSEVLRACQDGLTGRFDPQIDFVALVEGHLGVEDVWCIDHRGLLTLLLTKETYQQLGLVGEKASRKLEVYYIQIDLHDQTSSLYTRAKERIRLWEERRKAVGLLPWRVNIHGSLSPPTLQTELRPVEIQPKFTTLEDILIPVLDVNEYKLIQPQYGDKTKGPGESNSEGSEDDANERLEDLFEWIGMACLSSERLKVNDRPNSFVAQYDVPEPSRIGSVTHIRWNGFFGPSFVRRILETATVSGSNAGVNQDEHQPINFLSITSDLPRNTPISYISAKSFAEGAKNEVRLGRRERRVECWSLVSSSSAGNIDVERRIEKGKVKADDGAEEDEWKWILASYGS